MTSKTVFISSTFKDLANHRRAVWEALQRFNVDVRGMEQFGARTEGPLETCLAEVEQSDVYVGIIAFRLGSLDQKSRKSFTQLEYEHAVETGKDVLIYLADEETASFTFADIDDGISRKRLAAFKSRLREQHTVDTFSTPEDLAKKLSRDFDRKFTPKEPEPSADAASEEFERSAQLLQEFRLTPLRYNGQEVRLKVTFSGSPFPASRSLCRSFNLNYGDTIGMSIRITKPEQPLVTRGFYELYASGPRALTLRGLLTEKRGDIYALLNFSDQDVKRVTAEFFGDSYDQSDYWDDPGDGSVYIPP